MYSSDKIKKIVHIGASTFINSDCIQHAREILEPNSVDLIITDPPYGIKGESLHKHYNRDESFVINGYVEIPADQYSEFSRKWILEAERCLKPGGQIYIVSGYTNLYDILGGLRSTSLREVNHIIWKYNFGVWTSRKFISSHYHILLYEKPGARRHFNLQARYASDEKAQSGGSKNYQDREDVWVINREYKPGVVKNKNELPRALLIKMMQYSSRPGDLVVDFFMGGCSTAEVAIGMGCKFVGFEISTPIFESRVPAINRIAAGALLEGLHTPVPYDLKNQGKSWSEAEKNRALSLFEQHIQNGLTKAEAVDRISEVLHRGSWAINKVIAKYAKTRNSRTKSDPRLIPHDF